MSSSDEELLLSSSKSKPAGGKRRAVVISDEDDDLSSVSSISEPSDSDDSSGGSSGEDGGDASSDSSFSAAVARAARRQASVSFEKLDDTPERPAAAAPVQAGEGDAKAKQAPTGSRLASALPLVFPKQTKKSRACALVQIEDAGFDLSGDVGAIGRLTVVPNEGLILDLKGHQYAGTIVPSCSMFVVGFGPTEAKIETVVSDFVQTDHLANIIDSLSGSLLSGDAAAALLAFEDVDPEAGEAAAAGGVLRGRGDEGDDDGEGGLDDGDEALDPGAVLRKMEKKLTAKGKRDRAAAGLDEEEDGAKPAAKKAKTAGAGKVGSKGVYGKAVKVSRSGKRLTKKAAGSGGSSKKSGSKAAGASGGKKAAAAPAAKKAAAKKPVAAKKKKSSADSDTEEDSFEEDDDDDSDWE